MTTSIDAQFLDLLSHFLIPEQFSSKQTNRAQIIRSIFLHTASCFFVSSYKLEEF